MVATNLQADNNIISRFGELMRRKRLAHAYLFVGPQGVGKFETALGVAKLINCERSSKLGGAAYCDRCGSCLRIGSGNHPDVTVISSGTEVSIKIDQVRQLINHMQLRPYESMLKIFIIERIEDLTLQGSNALLKTLEEPAADSLLILTTNVLEKNLGTIRSRCHTVSFFPRPQRELMETLKGQGGVDRAGAHFLALFSEGYPGRARQWQAQGFLERKNDIIDRLVLKKGEAAFLKKLAADKAQIRTALDVLLSWFRDLLVVKADAGDECLMHADRRPALRKMAQRYDALRLQAIVRQIVETARMVEENLNVKIPLQLLMEQIWLK